MKEISRLVQAITRDRKDARRIARVSVQPWVWQELGRRDGIFITYTGFQTTDSPTPPVILYNILGVPMEIDEMQEEGYRLWDVGGERIEG